MDREALRKQAQQRRNHVSEEFEKPKWKCEYCGQEYKHEKMFMRHVCKEKTRIDEMKTVVGMAAYAYYGDWMKAKGRSVPPVDTFIHSTFYLTFMKFAEHVNKINMPAPNNFIRLMSKQDVAPNLWCRDNVYAMYMQVFDEAMKPDQQFIESVEYLLSYADKHDIDVTESFVHMGVDDFLVKVQKRQLSPWFLAASSVFRNWIKTIEEFDRIRVENSVKVGSLMIRISSDTKLSGEFGEFCRTCKEFNL